MQCPRCQIDNPPQANFCLKCGIRLALMCASCGTALPTEAKFCFQCGNRADTEPSRHSRFASPDTYTPSYLAQKILTSKGTLEGERKQVTVLFADLKGSMELLADRDPEEARKLLDPVLECMMEAVHRYEGTVNQVLGDGIMALFGAPLAHEDHAVRACFAALRMQESVKRYGEEIRRAAGVPIHIRVGLNSGEVVVRSIGNDLHMDYTAVGQTTSLAARMEQAALPGSILIPSNTLRMAEGYIQVKPLGPIAVKGLKESVDVYEVAGGGTIRSRFQATAAAQGLTRFVGRDGEMERLRQALERVRTGHGQVVAVVGEPGVGKSRFVWEFTHSYWTPDCLILESHPVSFGRENSYLAVVDLLKPYFKVHDRDNPREVREKVTGKLLTLDEGLKPTLPIFFALLDVSLEDQEWQRLDPLRRRQQTLYAVKRLFLRESKVQPLCLVFENLHWIDSETQAVLDTLVESLPTSRILLLVNYRPEYQHGWGGRTYYTQLGLDPLAPKIAEKFLDTLLADDSTRNTLKPLLIERTEGNPFFLEESIRSLVEGHFLVGERGAYSLAKPLPAIQVPATVQAVLAARIDRLPPEEKRLLQSASVIGRDVPFVLLEAIADLPEEDLSRGLSHLQTAEFLYETSLFPDLEYTFKHSLTHEVTYQSLLQERRRALHARIVDVIEQRYPDRLIEQVDRLAHHAFRGEVWNKAFTYLDQAGDKAAARSANREAVARYEQALDVLRHLPQNHETLRQAIDLRFDLRNALWPLGEPERIFDHLCEAKTLAETLGDQRRLGWVFSYLTQHFRLEGDRDRAIELARHSIAIAQSTPDFALQIATSAHLGGLYHEVGDYRLAVDLLRTNIDSLKGSLIRERFGLAGLPSVLLRFHLVWCLAELGNFAEGTARAQEGIRIAEEADSLYSLMFALVGAGILSFFQGELSQATPLLERGFELCRVWNLPILFPVAASFLGAVYALSGRVAEAIPLLEQAAELATSMKLMTSRSLSVARLAEGYLLAGRMGDAIRVTGRALELSREQKERGHEAYALRLLGEVLAHTDPPDTHSALSHYRQAMTVAEELGLRPLQAHIHLGLGQVFRRTEDRQNAEEHLAAASALFRELDMRFWLEKAEAELQELR